MSQDWPTPAESAKAAEAEHTEHAHGLHHHAHLHAQPAAEPAQPVELAQNAFISRLTSYSLVNSSWNTIKGSYEAAKNYSPVIKSGLEKAEAVSQRVYTAAEPHVRPVVVSLGELSEKYALDEKGMVVLDKVEAAAAKVQSTVEGAKAKVEETKQVAATAYQAGKDAAAAKTQQLVQTGNRPLNHFLDLAEIVVDKILPPTLQPAQDVPQLQEAATGQEDARLTANPITRATALGTDVTRRVAAKLPAVPTLTFRTPAEIAEMTHVVDLIQYAAQYIDVEGQKARIASVVEATQGKINEAKEKAAEAKETVQAKAHQIQESVAEKVQPVKALVEAQTADLKDKSVQQVVAVVASIAQVSEVLRRRVADSGIVHTAEQRREQLQARLHELVDSTKGYVQTLNEAQLRDYVTRVQSQSSAALAALVNVLNQSTAPITGTTVTGGLLSWTNSLAARLGYQVVPLRVEAAPAEALGAADAAAKQ